MSRDLDQLARAATRLADHLPYSVLDSFAEAVVQNGDKDWSAARNLILHSLPTASFRDAAMDFLDLWKKSLSEIHPEVVAAVLTTAAHAHLAHQGREIVELVWTGPGDSGFSFRQTEQAILEVLNSAKRRLTVVSFAVYRIPRIRDALVAAANRGVNIRLVVETPSKEKGRSEYDNLLALGENVASVSKVYLWPEESRSRDETNRAGILHVKCVVADEHHLFVSSANFTDYAFTLNMELGLLITGGKLPIQVDMHFDTLISSGLLALV